MAAGKARPQHFELWALATMGPTDEATLRALAQEHFRT
jgi:hypothetical protein